MLVMLLMSAMPGYAQEARRYTFDFRGVPLDQALQRLATTTGVGLVYGNAGYRLNEKWGFNVAFQLHTGWPYTLETRQSNHDPRQDQGPINGERASVYHRLDARINRYYTFSNRGL